MEHVIIRVNEDAAAVGWTFEQWMERGLTSWRTKADRVISCNLAVIVDAHDVVVAIGEVIGVRKNKNASPIRVDIEIEPDFDHSLLGKQIVVNDSRNPIAFVRELALAG